MVIPVGGDVHQVYVGTCANGFVAFSSVVNVGRSKSFLAEILLALLCSFAFVVAERHNLHTGDVREAVDCPRSTHAETHKGHAHGFHFGNGETEHVLLTGSALRSFRYDGSFLPMPVAGLRILGKRLSGCVCKE